MTRESAGEEPVVAAPNASSCLFIQLHVFTGCTDCDAVVDAVRSRGIDAAVYRSVNDPKGIGLVFAVREADDLVGRIGALLREPPFAGLTPLPAYTMLGRTYLAGYERDPDEVLQRRPRQRMLDPGLRWAIWYPLRRSGAFERIPVDEQRRALLEHGSVGAEFAAGGQAYDIRLACHGLDGSDNDFIIGIVGSELAPLSHLVERMRKTVQTSMYIEKLGPFFVGRVLWQSP